MSKWASAEWVAAPGEATFWFCKNKIIKFGRLAEQFLAPVSPPRPPAVARPPPTVRRPSYMRKSGLRSWIFLGDVVANDFKYIRLEFHTNQRESNCWNTGRYIFLDYTFFTLFLYGGKVFNLQSYLLIPIYRPCILLSTGRENPLKI